ncbi:uncharacterized protein LOC101735440 isoform X1 [Bombyx mori]|uniref:Thyroglobulin type-1 domain-containing protein n=1 Tax=Bombyx mori TaxID=7091 RepID=A0A8R2AV67_BOMMO|nr:uncharacterized protein LOC101735440 isoform X1 [Bombyx mori]
MAYFRLYLFLFCLKLVESKILCELGFCEKHIREHGCPEPPIHCAVNNATHSGLWLPSPTLCNCCPYCLTFIEEGDHCSAGGPGTGANVGRCGDGLTCVRDDTDGHSYCRRMTSDCHTAQDNFDARLRSGQVGALEHRPHCDGKGKFASFYCIPAHTCFCQSEEGERIFGEVLNLGSSTERNMHCGCSRLSWKIKKSIQTGVRLPVLTPRCTADGNFHPIQCIGNICYCVDTVTGIIEEGDGKEIDLDEEPVTELECYNPRLDFFPEFSRGEPPYQYTTPCLKDVTEKIDMFLQSIEDGFIVDYFNSFPECKPDGTYGTVLENSDGMKICADQRGVQIKDYEAKPDTPEYEAMNCNCAQTSLVMADALEKPVCCKNGNFRRIQCRRGMCRCVDTDGRQVGTDSSDVTRLPCFTANWRDC